MFGGGAVGCECIVGPLDGNAVALAEVGMA